MLGHVTKIVDPQKFVIKFTIKNVIEDAIAYPVDTFDEPNIGDPVEVTRLDDKFGESYTYKKLRLKNHTRIKLQKSIVDVYDTYVEIHAGEDKSIVKVNDDGSISIETTESVSVKTKDITVESESSVSVKTKTATIEANDVNIKGGNLTTVNGGSCTPTGTGGFCGIPVCPLTGAPHVGNKITGT